MIKDSKYEEGRESHNGDDSRGMGVRVSLQTETQE